ncbi:hypothetical protein KAK07_16770 [Ideonella sp. 4Y16]|uniref:Uncharacterized protein n=1 Tax=Ideonella alba TaxID=2824118 RepID=A0A940YC25_9BURK|nr:hypothetical protein [Ideonella alba]MBQ0931418.1 hypothetical protein [Ideonella alba]MBQ0944994.1 hypothetical protein [Ideonella alba]
MQHDFSTPAALWSDFTLHASVLAVAAVGVSLAVWALGRRSLPRWGVGESALVGALLLLIGLWVIQAQTLDRFWRIEASAGQLRLFPREGEPVIWRAADIDDVRYGFRGKLAYGPCRLVVETRDGQRLLTASQRLTLQDCQALRAQVLRALAP